MSDIVSKAAKLLPAQGPITAFVFLNPLQAFEDEPFESAVQRGQSLFGCDVYLEEQRYREKLELGRIGENDLAETLRRDLGSAADEPCGPTGSRLDLLLAALIHEIRGGPVAELNWFVAETDALVRYLPDVSPALRDSAVESTRSWATAALAQGGNLLLDEAFPGITADAMRYWSTAEWVSFSLRALWAACRQGIDVSPPPDPPKASRPRHRSALRAVTGVDSDQLVNGLLIPLCAAFLDQGFATWEAPGREGGLWRAFVTLYGDSAPIESCWRDLPQAIRRSERASAAEIIASSLSELGVTADQAEEYLTQELLALRGWGGMIWQSEDRGDRVPRPSPPGTLVEFMAVRLVLQKTALRWIIKQHLGSGMGFAELKELADRRGAGVTPLSPEQRAFQLFQLAQYRGWSAADLSRVSPAEWNTLVREVNRFGSMQRRRIFHLAFERRFRIHALNAIGAHTRNRDPKRKAMPRFQSVYCLDAREESFRRHLEEVCPEAETFGAAGFFGAAMYYRGVADAHYQALSPIVIRPGKWVAEEVVYSLVESDRRRAGVRKQLAKASHQFHVGSRGLTAGAFLTASLGVFATIPLVARVLAPRTTSRLRRILGSVVAPPPVTRLRLERLTEQPAAEGDAIGFTVTEMADVCERLLSEIGMREGLSRLMIFFGHGSFCMNNPHKSAYDCGACSGSAGGPNARALAAMLNDIRVRTILAERGLKIPADTVFIGGLHNTATDQMTYFDLDRLPRTHIADFEYARDQLEEACERNAQERCRRFYSAPLDITPEEAHLHVEGRAEDLAQTRPEFGNASNAMCIVGRRTRTRGLFLDRRSFLVSYDPTIDDDDSTLLGRILGAVVIVCSGINLQYYFSYVDPSGWGAGTKLPHNITSMLGVMDGASSDLRSGLPWQGVEIHEPARLLFVIESTPSAMEKIMARNPAVSNILRNGWVQLSLLDPQTGALSIYEDGSFHPYEPTNLQLRKHATSRDCYQGRRDHLDFAEVTPTAASS